MYVYIYIYIYVCIYIYICGYANMMLGVFWQVCFFKAGPEAIEPDRQSQLNCENPQDLNRFGSMTP